MEVFAAMTGNTWAYAFMFLIGAIIVGFINTVSKTKQIIVQLQERQGEVVSKNDSRRISVLVPCGLLLSSCAFLLAETVAHPIKLTIQVVAILFMLVGCYKTAQLQKK